MILSRSDIYRVGTHDGGYGIAAQAVVTVKG